MYAERGVYQDVVVGEPTRFEVAGTSGYVIPGVLLPASLCLDGMLKHSDIIVLDLRGVFTKVRSTYPIPLANAGARADVRRLTDGLVAALERSFVKPATLQ